MNWLWFHAGLSSGNGAWYLWWSGIVGDFGLLAIVGALAAGVRRWNCEVHHCWRLGRHTTAAGHRVCRKHHPDDHLTAEAVVKAHRLHLGHHPGPG